MQKETKELIAEWIAFHEKAIERLNKLLKEEK